MSEGRRNVSERPFELRWLVSFPQILNSLTMVCLWNEGLPFFCDSLLCESFGRACTTFRMRVGHGWKEWFPLSSAVCVDFSKS